MTRADDAFGDNHSFNQTLWDQVFLNPVGFTTLVDKFATVVRRFQ